MRFKITIAALLLLPGVGFWGGLSLSYANFNGQTCPQMGGLAICYVVTVAYGSMLAALFIKSASLHYIVFLAAWGITFTIALIGSGLELGQGGVCPKTWFMLPLCYVSLVMCLAIMGFYLLNRFSKRERRMKGVGDKCK